MEDYRETLNLPKTDFPMKANLPKLEPRILKFWEEINLYRKVRESRKGREVFVLHDGPPYANGRIHVGHALNKVLKDIINKFKLLKGYDINYIPGWDCHGLPIEREVEKRLRKEGKRKEEVGKVEFRKLCREYAKEFVEVQKEEFKRLGVLGDWENPYLTMESEYVGREILELKNFFQKGLVVRSKKPVFWCIYDKTAEAEAEIEYKEREDPSIYVKFKLLKEDAYLVIWTTTPWTLTANLGVMVGEDYEYLLIETKEGRLIVAKELLENFLEETGLSAKVLKTFKGKDLLFKEYEHPFIKKEELRPFLKNLEGVWKVYPSPFVELGVGTGLVHMSPGHGEEDFKVGKEFNLEPLSFVEDDGRLTFPEFLKGLRVFEANQRIIEILKERGNLLKEGKIRHSYPHCWRCKNPVILRATYQWFIKIDEDFKKRALEEIERVRWVPPVGKNRIRSMVENRPDWCISRQRYWGVPITVFYCKNCKEVVKDGEVIEHVSNLIREKGSDLWFEKGPEELLPEGYRCKRCGGKEFKKEEDILDVWFDSGSSHACVLKPLGIRRANLYLEGSDQHRGWFQSSLLESVGSYGEAPYKEVLTHGFVVDEKGRKMSKSLGNVISPEEIVKNYGADILRLWVVSEDYTQDVKLGKNILRSISEDYKKIRNTIRFMLANLYDFKETLEFNELFHFDRWIISKFSLLQDKVMDFYQNYEFHRVYFEVRNFIVRELSALYLDVSKDRLYVLSKDDYLRVSCQSALYTLLLELLKILSPILSFTCEEAYQNLKKTVKSLKESVFLETFKLLPRDEKVLKDYENLLKLRERVLKKLEERRREGLINHPYEAKVVLSPEGIPNEYRDFLNFFLTVSQVEFKEGEDVKVLRAEGKKCPRCWLYSTEFEGEVCKRCSGVLKEIKR